MNISFIRRGSNNTSDYNCKLVDPGSRNFTLTQWFSEIKDLDLSNVTSLQNSFNSFTNLKKVSIKNAGKVTNYNSCCKNSSSLTEVISSDTLVGTNYNQTFYGCTSLVDIPNISGEKVTNNASYNGFYEMFTNCTNLSNSSLEKILDMCISSTQVTENKTLSFMGLTSAQKTTCKSLSNYQEFVDAGWSV